MLWYPMHRLSQNSVLSPKSFESVVLSSSESLSLHRLKRMLRQIVNYSVPTWILFLIVCVYIVRPVVC